MINIYMTKDGEIFFFITPEWFSSNFDSLEQLAGVGLDDPDKRGTYPKGEYPALTDGRFDDMQLVVSISSFDVLNEEHYPELFI